MLSILGGLLGGGSGGGLLGSIFGGGGSSNTSSPAPQPKTDYTPYILGGVGLVAVIVLMFGMKK